MRGAIFRARWWRGRAVRCRLRYRISDRGTLTLWFEIIRPHKILEDAQRQMRTDIEAGTGHTVFVGAPASIPLA